jgi:hypothetical protein
MFLSGCDFSAALDALVGPRRYAVPCREGSHEPECKLDDETQRRKARWLWGLRRPLTGSVAERYARAARAYQEPLPPSLAFLPGRNEHPPALMAAFGFVDEPEPGVLAEPANVQSVHLTKLKADGSGKAEVEKQKIAIGPHCGLPVVTAPVNDLLGLAICEGIEDALSAATIGLGAWAACGANFMPKLAPAVPSYVECVTIFAHDDKGMNYATALERLLIKRAIEVRLDGAPP